MAITKEQALTASVFHAETEPDRPCDGQRGPIKWRRNGKTKTWKRNPLRFSVPVKWGLYSYGHITETIAANFHTEEDCPVNQLAEMAFEPVSGLDTPASVIGKAND